MKFYKPLADGRLEMKVARISQPSYDRLMGPDGASVITKRKATWLAHQRGFFTRQEIGEARLRRARRAA